MNEEIKARVDAVGEAQKRTRVAFFVAIVLSLCLIIVCWNAYGSWYRSFAQRSKWSEHDVTKFSQEQLVTEWIKSRMVSVPLLGIHVGVSDAPTLGSLSMLVIAIWFWFCAKQENQTIGRLLWETQRDDAEKRSFILHSITSKMVFTTVIQYDGAIHSLQLPLKKDITVVVRWVFAILIFLPAISTTSLIVTDVASLAFVSPFRWPRQPLHTFLEHEDWIHLSVETGIALVLVVLIYVICFQILLYVKSSASVIQEYSEIRNSRTSS